MWQGFACKHQEHASLQNKKGGPIRGRPFLLHPSGIKSQRQQRNLHGPDRRHRIRADGQCHRQAHVRPLGTGLVMKAINKELGKDDTVGFTVTAAHKDTDPAALVAFAVDGG